METQTNFAGDDSRRVKDTFRIPGFEGTALQPGHMAYDEARRVWNAMIDRAPALIARCSGAADVQRCVRFAREHGVALTVRGGGHNIGGRAVRDDAIMIDFSEQRGVQVDVERRAVDISPGALLRDVDRATLAHSLVLPTGIVSETGIAGLALGGGFGWLSRRFGLTCDHLIEAEVVTGSGALLRVNEHEHPDLFWALRGGGGAGTIVTNFRFQLQPFQPNVTAGMLFRPSEETEDVLRRYRTCAEQANEEVTWMLKLCAAPPAAFLPAALHGKPVGVTMLCHSGTKERAMDDVAFVRSGTKPIADLVQLRAFGEFQAMFDAGEPKGRRDYWKSEYVTSLDDQTMAVLLDAIHRLPSAFANIKIFQLGGAVCRMPAAATAAGNRDAQFIIVVASAWESPSDDARNIEWVRETWARVHERSLRGGYINFLTADASTDERNDALAGVDLARLAGVRKRYDPDGLLSV